MHNIDAEQAVLGSMMMDENAMDIVSDIIKPLDFYVPDHQVIYRAMLACAAESQGLDPISVDEQVVTAGGESNLGYLSQIMNCGMQSRNVRSAARIVKQRAADRGLIAAANQIAEIAEDHSISPEKKIDMSQGILMSLGHQAETGPVEVADLLVGYIDELERRNNGEFHGVGTGFTDLDEMLRGLMNSDLIILAGRPSMGKTTLAINIAENVAMDKGEPVLVFSLEMPSQQLIDKVVSSRGKIDLKHVQTGQMDGDEWARLSHGTQKIKASKLIIDDTGGLTIDELRGRSRREKRKNNISLIVVDYLQLLTAKGTENRVNEIGTISRGLKALAKELDIPVLALSQLSRAVEQRTDKRPIMSDLRESGSLEQDADVIAFVYRDDYYNPDSPDSGTADILIRKHRTGKTGRVKLMFQGEFSKFSNLALEGY